MFKYLIAAIIGAAALILVASAQGALSQEQSQACMTPAQVTANAAAMNVKIIRDVADPDEIQKLKETVAAQFQVTVEDQTYDRAIYIQFDKETAGVVIFRTDGSGNQCSVHHWTSSLDEVLLTLKLAFGQEVSD